MNRHFQFLNRLTSILLILFALAVLAPATARADTITTFGVSGFVSGGGPTTPTSCVASCKFSGTLTIDVSSGTVMSIDLTFPGLSPLTTLQGSGNFSIPITPNWAILASNGAGDFAYLIFSTQMTPGSLVNFNGGTIVGQNVFGPTGNGTAAIYNIGFGTITPVPEPSSILLLGTGLAAIAGTVRYKLMR